ncbi:baseplate J/gp47 family protein [Acetobacter sicerae]|uniref:baseplate J/gp47 family protein n=1 Tax=Acetobacter sicerae TaxID=85325 RepID=UPI00156B04C6|nr:baseplate J/gp47 family protein [Acetobacter sicerae]NHN93453.1 hypothetical protein [Acetobacter sicerae]
MVAISSVSDIACTVDATGIYAPTYSEILEWLQGQFLSIYGADVSLDNSTQDGQWIGIIAQAVNASNQATIAAFNSFRPSFAQGAGLSSVVKINGISRDGETYSTCDVVISGAVGATITNGSVRDTLYKYLWSLPTPISIPTGGTVTVTATCTTAGAVMLGAGTLTIIATPADGWTSVTNATASAPGQAVQSDASLRLQQSGSTMLPSQTVLDGIEGGILSLSGVTAVCGYENDTDAADANGIPAYSTCMVVEGGDAAEIATVIANKKTMGSPTFGNTTETVTDSYGNSRSISFQRAVTTTITVAINLTALTGYTDAIGSSIASAVADYISGLTTGTTIYAGRVYSYANLASADGGDTYEIDSITLGTSGGASGLSKITLAFDAIPTAASSNVTITASG